LEANLSLLHNNAWISAAIAKQLASKGARV
jgi:hypothetical protein